jgi:site-specific recombinase XerD
MEPRGLVAYFMPPLIDDLRPAIVVFADTIFNVAHDLACVLNRARVIARQDEGPFTPSGFAKLLARAGDEAKIGFKVHPHMLRHACGYALANKGIDTRTLQAYLGHRSINSTTRYAALAPGRFKNIWSKG